MGTSVLPDIYGLPQARGQVCIYQVKHACCDEFAAFTEDEAPQ